jgi:dTDP-4-dehydrorhamnose reductase
MRILVAGARGLLGSAITRELSTDCEVHAVGRADLDLTDAAAVAEVVGRVRPDAIVNCAAFSGVDAAEDRPDTALAVNAFAVLELARAAARMPCTLVHYSTDFVFDGATDRPYTEDDAPDPRSFYGLSKLLGEWFAAEHDRSYVLRVESLFGDPGPGAPPKGSVHAIVQRILDGDEVPVFVDRTVSPSYTVDVARATRALLRIRPPAGLYHCVNSGAATWAAVADEVARLLDRPARVRPMTLESANLRAPRPRYCALSNEKLARAGIRMPSWQHALARYLGERARYTGTG